MIQRDPDRAVWTVIGAIGALTLGFVLIPLRSLTSASNLAFVFVIFTIVVAELGGRAAGLIAAVVSALTLNFFLTEPYLTLAIHKTDDVVAFFALAISGLIAAAFGRRRVRSAEMVSVARHDLEALGRTADGLAAGTGLPVILEELRRAFRLGALVLRSADGRPVAAVPADLPVPTAATIELEARALGARDVRDDRPRLGSRGFRLPEGGGRVRLGPEVEAPVLELWEGDDDQGLSPDDRRALSVATTMLGLALRGTPDLGREPGRR